MCNFATRLIAILVCGSLVAFPITPAYAQGAGSAGQVTARIPEAEISRPAGTLSADVGTAVLWDDLVETQPRGRVRITLDDSSILNVGSNSSLRVVQHDAQTRQTDLTLTFGKMRARVQKLGSGQRFEVRSNTAVLGVIGTDFYVLSTATQTQVIVYDGMVLIQNLNPAILGSTQVFAGQQAVVNANQPPSAPTSSNPSDVRDSVQETNVGEDLPAPPQRPTQPPSAAGMSKWWLIGASAGIAAVSIIVPIANKGSKPEPSTLPSSSSSPSRGQD